MLEISKSSPKNPDIATASVAVETTPVKITNQPTIRERDELLKACFT